MKQAVDEEDRSYFKDYCGNKLDYSGCQGVYGRLYMEMERRRKIFPSFAEMLKKRYRQFYKNNSDEEPPF